MPDFVNFLRDCFRSCKDEQFNRYKLDLYCRLICIIVVISCFSECSYWLTDCQIAGYILWDTFVPRFLPILLAGLYIFLYEKLHSTKHEKLLVLFAYLCMHLIMWSTIWAIVYLPDKTHAREGFIIMHLMFMTIGYMVEYKISLIGHGFLLVDIFVSNYINHYEDFGLMLTFAILCYVVIEFLLFLTNKGLHDRYLMTCELQSLSYHDQLTGLYNRNMLKNGVKFNEKYLNSNSCVALFDIDFFKNVNDTYGHGEGDEVLRKVACVIESVANEYECIPIRWGGEEFLVVGFNINLSAMKCLAETVRLQVEQLDTLCCKLTVSGGVSKFVGDLRHTINRADAALYEAKSNGRNCIKLPTDK